MFGVTGSEFGDFFYIGKPPILAEIGGGGGGGGLDEFPYIFLRLKYPISFTTELPYNFYD
jgi:hypothetical protein